MNCNKCNEEYPNTDNELCSWCEDTQLPPTSLYDGKRGKLRNEKRKQFILFAWEDRHPCGGVQDIRGTYATAKGALIAYRKLEKDYLVNRGSILDRLTCNITQIKECPPNRMLEYWGIEVTGTWFARTSLTGEYLPPEYKWVVSQKVWDSIKGMSVEEFEDTPNIRGIGRATRRKILRNIREMR
jgi:hypothetical protein